MRKFTKQSRMKFLVQIISAVGSFISTLSTSAVLPPGAWFKALDILIILSWIDCKRYARPGQIETILGGKFIPGLT